MAHFVVITHRTPGADVGPHLDAERRRAQELHAEGVIASVLRKVDDSGAVLTVTAPDAASARRSLETLPLATAGLMTLELIEVDAP